MPSKRPNKLGLQGVSNKLQFRRNKARRQCPPSSWSKKLGAGITISNKRKKLEGKEGGGEEAKTLLRYDQLL